MPAALVHRLLNVLKKRAAAAKVLEVIGKVLQLLHHARVVACVFILPLISFYLKSCTCDSLYSTGCACHFFLFTYLAPIFIFSGMFQWIRMTASFRPTAVENNAVSEAAQIAATFHQWTQSWKLRIIKANDKKIHQKQQI